MGRPFDDRCPVARTLSVIGEKWTLLIVRDLYLEGPRRFQDFDHARTGIAPNTLSARLKRLEAEGIVTRRLYSEHPPRYEYLLTEKGRALGPILAAMRNWGNQFPAEPSLAKGST